MLAEVSQVFRRWLRRINLGKSKGRTRESLREEQGRLASYLNPVMPQAIQQQPRPPWFALPAGAAGVMPETVRKP